MNVTFDSVTKMGLAQWRAALTGELVGDPTSLLLLGPPGTGKTAVGSAIFEGQKALVARGTPRGDDFVTVKLGDKEVLLREEGLFLALDTTSSLPEDIAIMFPMEGEDGEKRVEALLQGWLADACRPGAWGTIVVDDIAASMPSTPAKFLQIILAREAYGKKMSPSVSILVTGNRRKDGAGASTLPSHFRNATCILELDPDLKAWQAWYAGQGLPLVVSGYLEWKSQFFSQDPGSADAKGSFATPRTWAKVGQALLWTRDDAVFRGLVGDGPGSEFGAFLRLQDELVDPRKVLENPERAVPNPLEYLAKPDRALAMLMAVAEMAVREPKLVGKFIPALAWLGQGPHVDKAAVAATSFIAAGGKIESALKATNPADLKSPHMIVLLGRIKAMFGLGGGK